MEDIITSILLYASKKLFWWIFGICLLMDGGSFCVWYAKTEEKKNFLHSYRDATCLLGVVILFLAKVGHEAIQACNDYLINPKGDWMLANIIAFVFLVVACLFCYGVAAIAVLIVVRFLAWTILGINLLLMVYGPRPGAHIQKVIGWDTWVKYMFDGKNVPVLKWLLVLLTATFVIFNIIDVIERLRGNKSPWD